MIDPVDYDRLMLERSGIAVALIKDEDELRLCLQVEDGHLEIRGASVMALLAMLKDLFAGSVDV